jgi:hypothetical protein
MIINEIRAVGHQGKVNKIKSYNFGPSVHAGSKTGKDNYLVHAVQENKVKGERYVKHS